jgi:hypothetical protein
MENEIFEVDIECQSCGGTGLYVGMAERDGAAVVCCRCKGSGKFHHKFTYTPFVSRVKRKDVRRVFGNGCGYVHSADNVVMEDKTQINFTQAGASYDEWLNGKKPIPLKTLYCPLQWSSQRWSHKGCPNIGCITSCPSRCNMDKCWKLYDEENKE